MKPTYTSDSLPLVVDFLPPDCLPQPGQIGFTIAPGRNDEDSKAIWQRDLQADLTRMKDHYSVDRLVCLLGADERAGLGIATLLDDAAALGHHQMGGEGGFSRAHGPNMQIVDLRHSR